MSDQLIRASKAENTWRAYAQDWAGFVRWYAGTPITPSANKQALTATADDVVQYIRDALETGVPALVRDGSMWRVELHTHKPASIARRITGIGRHFVDAGVANPCASEVVKCALSGAHRLYAEKAEQLHVPIVRRSKAATRDILMRMLPTDHDTNRMQCLRDRALLLIGMAGALRRSELVALHVADLDFGFNGLTLTIRRSQHNRSAQQEVPVCYGGDECPVRALQDWLHAAGISDGPVFRPVDRHGNVAISALSATAVGEVVKRRAEAAGLNPREFTGHSLRAGCVTQAAIDGVSLPQIMAHSRHRTPECVSTCVRMGRRFDNPALSLWGNKS